LVRGLVEDVDFVWKTFNKSTEIVDVLISPIVFQKPSVTSFYPIGIMSSRVFCEKNMIYL